MTCRISVPIPSVVRLNLGATLDVAWAQHEGQLASLPPGARVALQAGLFEWRVDDASQLPVSVVFISGARRTLVELSAGPAPAVTSSAC